jgi:hypothetical protein
VTTPPDEKTAPILTVHRKSYIISIWAERPAEGTPVWRGYLETTVGQRSYFASLADLNRMLRERGGWEELTSNISVEEQS